MIYQRGNPMDYEGWAEPEGMETWDFAHCLPYFKTRKTFELRHMINIEDMMVRLN